MLLVFFRARGVFNSRHCFETQRRAQFFHSDSLRRPERQQLSFPTVLYVSWHFQIFNYRDTRYCGRTGPGSRRKNVINRALCHSFLSFLVAHGWIYAWHGTRVHVSIPAHLRARAHTRPLRLYPYAGYMHIDARSLSERLRAIDRQESPRSNAKYEYRPVGLKSMDQFRRGHEVV